MTGAISEWFALKSSVVPSFFFVTNLTFPLNLSVSQSVHFSESGGTTNLKGPLLVVVAIGRVIIFVARNAIFDLNRRK